MDQRAGGQPGLGVDLGLELAVVVDGDAALGQLGRGGLDQPLGEQGRGLLVERAEDPGPVDRPDEGEGDDLAAVFAPDLDLGEEVEDPGRPPAFVAAELPEPADERLGLEPVQHLGPGVVPGQRVGVAQAELRPDVGVGGAHEQVVDPLGVEDGGDPLQEPEHGGPVVGRHRLEHEHAAVDRAPHLVLRQQRDVGLAEDPHDTPPGTGPGRARRKGKRV